MAYAKNLKHIENFGIIGVQAAMISLHREKEKNIEGFVDDGINDGERFVYNAMLSLEFEHDVQSGIVLQLALSDFDPVELIYNAASATFALVDVETVLDAVSVFEVDSSEVKGMKFSITEIMEYMGDVYEASVELETDTPPTLH
jgi:hypothetical protein